MIPGLPADVEQLGATPIMDLHHMRKAKPRAKDYVRDGLIAMWDGIENAGWGVHNPAATTWKDLMGTTSGTDIMVRSGYFTDDALVALPASGGSRYNTTTPGALPSSDVLTTEVAFTIPEVVRFTGLNEMVFAWRSTSAGPLSISAAWGYLRVTGGGYGTYGRDDNSYDLAPYIGQEFRATCTDFVGQDGLYVNGGLVRPLFKASAASDNRYPAVVNVGGQTELMFHSVRVYNRLLTAAEIAGNHAIDKERFNLP